MDSSLRLDGYMPVKVISGHDCVKKNGNVFASFGKKCLLVTGGSSAVKSGALQDVETVLLENDTEYSVFNEIEPNPTVESCRKAGIAAGNSGADFIVGIGGGSAQDAAKAVAIFAAEHSLTCDSVYTRAIPAKHLPLILVGTTAGTGSEVTGVSVLTNTAGFKKSISGADCYAAVSFCDAKYTYSVPYSATVSTALDAYAHAFESYFASTSNGLSEMYACKALSLLWPCLLWFREHPGKMPDDVQRDTLYSASLYAGLAINITGTGFPHTVGYILTEEYGVPHGKACTAFHPLFTEKAEKYCSEKFGTVCALLHTDKQNLLSVIGALTDVSVEFTDEQKAKYRTRWKLPVKNFDRSPGGFLPEELF